MNKLRFKDSNSDLFFVEDMNDNNFVAIEYNNGERAQVVKISEGRYISHSTGENNTHLAKVTHTSIYDLCCGFDVKDSYVFECGKDIIKFLIEKKI